MADSATATKRKVADTAEARAEDQYTQRFIPAQDLMISCGCVPVDPVAKKIAIIYDPQSGYTQLPKGRKNIHEDLHATAIRETCEETGLNFSPLPLTFTTRATPSAELLQADSSLTVTPTGVTKGVANCEPSSVCVYRCRSTNALKMVFWFAAQGSCEDKPNTEGRESWEESFQVEWVNAKDASSRMDTAADASVIEKVLTDMRNSGYDI